MRFKEIILQNFKPFYGEIPIDISDEPGVTLFGARNDRGKTAFLEAVRFCLYDFTSDDEGSREEKRNFCINRQAVTEADGETSVAILFEHNSSDYKIKRVLKYSQVDNRSARTAENHYVTVTIDNQETPISTHKKRTLSPITGNSETESSRKTHPNSSFSTANRSTNAHNNSEKETPMSREAIELVLGIEELRKAEDDLYEHGISEYRDDFQEAR
ncbi:MAG: ATP-binding protein [Natrialbaceae archaeon]|nr:ATP-binding protein [Natrialbaceae archaeon]